MYGAAIIWGTWVLVLSNVSLPGYFITAITSLTGFVGLLAYVLWKKSQKSLLTVLKSRKLLKLTALVAFFEAAQNALFMAAFLLAVAGGGSIFIPIIRALIGVVTPMLTALTTKKEFSARYLVYGIIASLGMIIIFSWEGLNPGGRVSYLGLSLVGASVIIAALEMIVIRLQALEMSSQKQPSTSVMTYQTLLAGIFLLPLLIYYFATNEVLPVDIVSQIGFISIFGLTHVALAFILRLKAMRHITASQAVIIGYLEPITSVALSVIFLRESFNLGFVIGGALVLYAAIAAGLRSAKPS